MEIKYNLDVDDYINFNLYHMSNSQTGKRAVNIQRFLVPVIFVIVAIFAFKIAHAPFLGVFMAAIIISALWIMYYPRYFQMTISQKLKNMFKEDRNAGLLGEHKLILNDQGVTETTNHGETKAAWPGIIKFEEDHDYYYIYNSAVTAFILPKRAVRNENFKEYVQSRLSE